MIVIDPLANHGFHYGGKYRLSCHLFSDKNDKKELLDFSKKLNLKPHWIHKSNNGILHFDIIESKRNLAVSFGAVELDRKEAIKIIYGKL